MTRKRSHQLLTCCPHIGVESWSFLGTLGSLRHLGYYKKFIRNYAEISAPMEDGRVVEDTNHIQMDRSSVYELCKLLKDQSVFIPISIFLQWTNKPVHPCACIYGNWSNAGSNLEMVMWITHSLLVKSQR